MGKGLENAKKYDWKDSNMALFGSDPERQVNKDSALTEPAWDEAGQEVGLQIWRIVKFQVKRWPRHYYGKFFSSESYIILNTYKPDPENDALAWDVHFWIGKYSSQDEYDTGAYKTVELDAFLDDGAVQHREVQGYESELFQTYFEKMSIMEGGSDTEFLHVWPGKYETRLMRFTRHDPMVKATEIQLTKKMLNSDEVFILDAGTTIYSWNGKDTVGNYKYAGHFFCKYMQTERTGRAEAKYMMEEGQELEEFWEQLPDEDIEADDDDKDAGSFTPTLFKVSEDSGSPKMTTVKEGKISMDDFSTDCDDVFIFDDGKSCFVIVGSGASLTEKRNGLPYAHKHLQKTAHPCAAVSVVPQGKEETNSYKAFVDAVRIAAYYA